MDKSAIRARFMAAMAAGCGHALAVKIANGKAEFPAVEAAGPAPDVPGAPVDIVARVGADSIASLRARYAALIGKKPFGGWDADTLRQKIADAGGVA